jgi:hypothetical protein
MSTSICKKIGRDFVKSHIEKSTLTLIMSVIGLGVVAVNPSGAVTFGTNLIVNGAAEASIGSPVPGWSESGVSSPTFTSVQYGTTGFPSTTDGDPTNRGSNFFAGGANIGFTTAVQFIDLGAGDGVIDAGNARFNESGFFGGKIGEQNYSALSTIFYGANGGELFRTSLGGYSTGSSTGLFEQSTSGLVPIGTRRISLQLTLLPANGLASYNNGYADNLSLVFTDINASATNVPEPSSIPGILIGGALVVGAIKHRQQKSS